MIVKVKCPKCEKVLQVHVEHLTCPVECLSCWHLFVPVEDSEVPCPRCGSVVVMPHGGSNRKVSCLECGFLFPGLYVSRRRQLWMVLAASALVTISILYAALTS